MRQEAANLGRLAQKLHAEAAKAPEYAREFLTDMADRALDAREQQSPIKTAILVSDGFAYTVIG